MKDMIDKKKNWRGLIFAGLALILILFLAYWARIIEVVEDSPSNFSYRLLYKILGGLILIAIYRAYVSGRWLFNYYHRNPDRAKSMIPGGFKNFFLQSESNSLRSIDAVYKGRYDYVQILSVGKVILYRHRGPKFLGANMTSPDGVKNVKLKNFTVLLKIHYRPRQHTHTQTDYYLFYSGNYITDRYGNSFKLPKGWDLEDDDSKDVNENANKNVDEEKTQARG